MTVKDILVHVDNDNACRNRIEVAVNLAVLLDANLTGVYVRRHFSFSDHNVPDSDAMEVVYEDILNDNESEAHSSFNKLTLQGNAEVSWRSSSGSLPNVVVDEARYCDLLVLGQPDPKDQLSLDEGIAGEIIMSSGCPCLLIPCDREIAMLARSPLIVWDGSRESSRAVNDALPLLKESCKATVLIIMHEPTSTAIEDRPDTMISEHLARHDIDVKVDVSRESLQSTGDKILSYADANEHDLIIMGAYGHARWREIVLGSATRAVLKKTKVPVLMSH